eukprot:scaffold446962_cov18-Prasinocladus_malaysianus.AAC.1
MSRLKSTPLVVGSDRLRRHEAERKKSSLTVRDMYCCMAKLLMRLKGTILSHWSHSQTIVIASQNGVSKRLEGKSNVTEAISLKPASLTI